MVKEGIKMDLYQQMGQQSLTAIVAYILFIGISFYALQCLRLEQIFKKGMTFQIQLTYILLSVAIGSAVAKFFVDFLALSQKLQYLI